MRKIMNGEVRAATAVALITATFAAPAHAYIGPGAGLSIAGSIVAVLGAILFGIVGFIWYPIRRLMRRRKAKRALEVRSSADERSATEPVAGTDQNA